MGFLSGIRWRLDDKATRLPLPRVQVFVGGSILRGGPVTVCRDEELKCQPDPLVIKVSSVASLPSVVLWALALRCSFSAQGFWGRSPVQSPACLRRLGAWLC